MERNGLGRVVSRISSWSLREIVLFNSLSYHKFRQLVFSEGSVLSSTQVPNKSHFLNFFLLRQRVLNCFLPVFFPVFSLSNKLFANSAFFLEIKPNCLQNIFTEKTYIIVVFNILFLGELNMIKLSFLILKMVLMLTEIVSLIVDIIQKTNLL